MSTFVQLPVLWTVVCIVGFKREYFFFSLEHFMHSGFRRSGSFRACPLIALICWRKTLNIDTEKGTSLFNILNTILTVERVYGST
jgi:hypothetical protein